VLVLESADQPGGLAASFRKDDFDIPFFYHHVFKQELVTQDYLRRAGVVIDNWMKVRMGINVGEGTVNFSNPFELIKWSYLSLPARVRFGLFGASFFIPQDWSRLKGVSAESWLLKSAGREVTERIFKPLMFNKFGMPLSKISAEWLATRLAAREAQSFFGYPKGGVAKLVNYLVKRNKSKIVLKARLSSVDLKAKTVIYNGHKVKYDLLINTIPMPVLLPIIKGLPAKLKRDWSRVRFIRHLSLVVAHDKPLEDFYWINVFGKDFGGIIQHSYLNDVYPFKLSFVFSYAPSDKLWKLSDKQVQSLFLKRLKELYPHVKPKWSRVTRAVYADPFCDNAYKSYKPQYETGVPGFYNAGIQVTSPDYMRSMNNSLLSGQIIAEKILSSN